MLLGCLDVANNCSTDSSASRNNSHEAEDECRVKSSHMPLVICIIDFAAKI